ncbi:hypothetical protein AAVH_14961 [Aphelenchoides avenae]|nr:hypothetical protein AAVH_14961 [Aphelenchus avenae]
MLPTEAFAEAVAFLRLFDLSALAVTNALSSSLAVRASNAIRYEEFPGLRFLFVWDRIEISRMYDASVNGDGPFDWQHVASLTFASANDQVEFFAAAIPNCVFEDVDIPLPSKNLLDAVGRVADSVVVNGALGLPASLVSAPVVLNFVRKFRKVK